MELVLSINSCFNKLYIFALTHNVIREDRLLNDFILLAEGKISLYSCYVYTCTNTGFRCIPFINSFRNLTHFTCLSLFYIGQSSPIIYKLWTISSNTNSSSTSTSSTSSTSSTTTTTTNNICRNKRNANRNDNNFNRSTNKMSKDNPQVQKSTLDL